MYVKTFPDECFCSSFLQGKAGGYSRQQKHHRHKPRIDKRNDKCDRSDCLKKDIVCFAPSVIGYCCVKQDQQRYGHPPQIVNKFDSVVHVYFHQLRSRLPFFALCKRRSTYEIYIQIHCNRLNFCYDNQMLQIALYLSGCLYLSPMTSFVR